MEEEEFLGVLWRKNKNKLFEKERKMATFSEFVELYDQASVHDQFGDV